MISSPLDDVLVPIVDFRIWLKSRKTGWRAKRGRTDEDYRGYERREYRKRVKVEEVGAEEEGEYYRIEGGDEFWVEEGYGSEGDWKESRGEGWRRGYSWNKVRLEVIQVRLGG